MRLLDLELSGPDEIAPGIVCEAAGGHTEGSMNILVETAEGTACICGDVIYDIQNQVVDPIYQVLDYEPQSTGNQGTSKRQERAAIKRALNSGTLRATDPRLPGPRRARPGRVAARRRLGAGPRARRRASDDRRDAEDGPRPGGVQDPGCRAVTAHVGSRTWPRSPTWRRCGQLSPTRCATTSGSSCSARTSATLAAPSGPRPASRTSSALARVIDTPIAEPW